MQITGGRLKGARLKVPRGIRPTSAHVRRLLFDWLDPEGTRLLELYAGSGAVGLEALSRGAAEAVFVEANPRACRAIRENLETLGLKGRVICAPVRKAIKLLREEGQKFDWAFADPPYALDPGEDLKELWLIIESYLVLEREADAPEIEGFELVEVKHARGKRLLLYRRLPG